MNCSFYSVFRVLILVLTCCTYTIANSHIITLKQFYAQLCTTNPVLAQKIYLSTKHYNRKQQARNKVIAFLRKSAAVKKILQKHSPIIIKVYEGETIYGTSTVTATPHAYQLKVYSNYYRPGIFTLTDQDVYGTLEIQQFGSQPDNTIIAPSGEAFMNLCDPANIKLFDYFKETANDNDVITFACRNPSYLKDAVIQKRVVPIIPTLPDHLLTSLMQNIDDATLCSLLTSTASTALIKRDPVLKRCSRKSFYPNLPLVSEFIAYQILRANIKYKSAVLGIIDNKRSLLTYKDVLDILLKEPLDNDYLLTFIDCATAEAFAKGVYARPNLWDNTAIKQRILQLDDWAASATRPYNNPGYFNLLFWLGNYIRLDARTSAAAKKFMREQELKIPLITKNFNTVNQWITQSHIHFLFDILERKEYPGTALRFNIPSSPSSCVVELNEDTHAALETLGRLATDLNQAGKADQAYNILKAFMFLKGTTLEGMTIAYEMLKFYPVYLVGQASIGLANPKCAAILGTCLIIYNTYCTSIDLKTHFCSMLQSIQDNNFESAGRHAARIGINLVTFKHVFNLLKALTNKFILNLPNIPIFKAVEDQIQKNKGPQAGNTKLVPLGLSDINSKINALPDDIINKKEFAEAFERFHKLPGALKEGCPFYKIFDTDKLDKNIDKQNAIKGAWYEIKKALDLFKQGETIESLSVKYTDVIRGKAEFDIQTTSKLIECKNSKWIEYENIKDLSSEILKKINKRRTDLTRHRLIAEEFIQKKFEVYSKQPIPSAWKDWLTKNNITFFEEV